jgi:hypothetical protein|uniref:Uncharacterized protein n=1 Tax=Siphoviridae sp. ctABi4 TaxID=2823566 RepID=A0A8S5LFN3_9CAUD|nr:MAG TPA: hypothetical protein [Siphoviridae sp. ctABi4]
MNISQVKRSLGRKVLYNGAKYILTGCIIRRGITGKFYYQAEIKDLNANSALLYCRLEDLEEMK